MPNDSLVAFCRVNVFFGQQQLCSKEWKRWEYIVRHNFFLYFFLRERESLPISVLCCGAVSCFIVLNAACCYCCGWNGQRLLVNNHQYNTHRTERNEMKSKRKTKERVSVKNEWQRAVMALVIGNHPYCDSVQLVLICRSSYGAFPLGLSLLSLSLSFSPKIMMIMKFTDNTYLLRYKAQLQCHIKASRG